MKDFLYPFLWVTDDDLGAVCAEIEGIRKSGATAFCVESRIHPDFCGPRWWRMMDGILAAAKERDMRVWLLDDKHYPTGSAADAIAADSPLRPWRIKADCIDLEGLPGKIRLILNSVGDEANEDQILGVWLLRMRDGARGELLGEVSDCVKGNFLELDYDGTPLRVCCVKQTRSGAEGAGRERYIDMLEPASVDVLIDTVYRPHYERYGEKYRDTFVGFFSDEPRFANGFANVDLRHGYDEYNTRIGIPGMAYPYRKGLAEEILKGVPGAARGEILSLWFDLGERTSEIRCRYMDLVTRAYAENFSGRLASWCHERGLTYCGHIIEDMGAHAHLGCSAGHYFRSQRGADCAAVDVVLHQIKPFYRGRHLAPIAGGYADPLFFDGTLAKLASSCAHIDPEKQGRALCEIFGAYGWGESLSEMAYLANHMLVRGINRFIPHAFSSVYPNVDCPPHFYCGGRNFGFAGYCIVSRYLKRMSQRLSEGQPMIRTAVLYHAEADWSGRDFAPVDGVARTLMENQIDFDILPSDALNCADKYTCLIVPWAEFLPESVERKLSKTSCSVLRLSKSPDWEGLLRTLTELGCRTLTLSTQEPGLRVLGLADKEKNLYFLHNEGGNKIETEVTVGAYVSCLAVDWLNNERDLLPVVSGKCRISLEPGKALLLQPGSTPAPMRSDFEEIPVLWNLSGEDEHSLRFSGTLTLESEDEIEFRFEGEMLSLRLGEERFEGICSPFRVRPGRRGRFLATAEIGKNPAEILRDDLSKYSVLRPARLLNCVLRRKK